MNNTCPMKLWCVKHASVRIISNMVFHERIKLIKIGDQLANVFTKALNMVLVILFVASWMLSTSMLNSRGKVRNY